MADSSSGGRATAADPADGPTEKLDVELARGSLVVWTSPYAPFFGEDDLALLRTLGALTGVALDRVRLFQAEHEARLALERANEVKSSFVALAAHELRTPMTTIHGFVTTLHHLGHRLDDGQREQLREALVQQTQRMALLIEQLLDLSRLDADAIEIAPQPVPVRRHVEELVATTAPDAGAVAVDVAETLVALVDRNALDRILSNLVTNAFRYGAPPVLVRAEHEGPALPADGRGRGPGRRAGVRPRPVRTVHAQRRLARAGRRHRARPRDRALVRPRTRRRAALRARGAARRSLPARAPDRDAGGRPMSGAERCFLHGSARFGDERRLGGDRDGELPQQRSPASRSCSGLPAPLIVVGRAFPATLAG